MATLEEIGKRIGAYEQPQNDGISRIVQNWGMQLIKEMQINLLKNKTNASSVLYQSIVPEITPTPNGYALKIMMESYGERVEEGQSPHKPPFKDLYEWVKNKKSLQVNVISKAGKKNREVAMRSLAFAVQRAIEKNGTRAQPFINPALRKVTTDVLSDRIATYIKDSIEK